MYTIGTLVRIIGCEHESEKYWPEVRTLVGRMGVIEKYNMDLPYHTYIVLYEGASLKVFNVFGRNRQAFSHSQIIPIPPEEVDEVMDEVMECHV